MNNKISGTVLHTGIQFGQFKFLKMLYRVIQTELLQEPVFAHCAPPPTLRSAFRDFFRDRKRPFEDPSKVTHKVQTKRLQIWAFSPYRA